MPTKGLESPRLGLDRPLLLRGLPVAGQPTSKSALAIAGFTILFACLVEMRGISDVDLFWQVRTGQVMIETGHFYNVEIFSYYHLGNAVPCIYWVSQLIYAALYRLGSWRALLILHAVVFAGAFGLAGHLARKGRAGLIGVIAAMVLGFSTGLTNSDLRPQSFGLLGFSILLMIVSGDLRWGVRLPLAVMTLLIWQNTHPSVLVGAVAVSGLMAADWIDYLRNPGQPKPWGLTFLLLLVASSQFATPMGIGILETNRDNLRVARFWLREGEWLPPWDPTVARSAVIVFWIALVITAVLLAMVWKEVSLRQWFTFGVMTLLALYASRFALFWGLAMVPVWANWIDRVRAKDSFQWGNDPLPPRALLGTLLGGVLLILLVPSSLRPSLFDHRFPLEGIRRLKAALPAGRIYNFRQWGGPLIFEGGPEWKVALDGRLFLYTNPEEWLEYQGASTGRVSLDDLVRRHRPDAFFLHPLFQKPLAESLRRAKGWGNIYENANVIVFVRI